MGTLNPMQLMTMLKRGNPRWVAMQIVQQNYPNDPTAQNLIQMAERGDTQNLEKVVGNMLGAQGKDFSAEMQNLLNGVRQFQ
jgi:hypothetical protein